MAFGLGLFSLGLVGSAVVPFVFPNGRRTLPIMVVCGIGYACFVWFFWTCYKRAQDVFLVDDSGITRTAPDGSKFRLLWEDIAAVKPREKFQRLDLYDSTGRRVMRLEYQLENFAALRALLYEKTIALYERASQKSTFYKGKSYYVPMAVSMLIPLAIVLLAATQRATGAAAFSLAITLCLVFVVLKETWRAEIKTQGLVVSSFLSSRKVSWSSIRQIDLGDVRTQRGNTLALVSVILEDGSQIKFTQFEDGSLVLYYALRKAWSGHRAYPP
jgi:hypothetical protein